MSKISVLAFRIWSCMLPGKIYEKSVQSKVNIEFLDRVFLNLDTAFFPLAL